MTGSKFDYIYHELFSCKNAIELEFDTNDERETFMNSFRVYKCRADKKFEGLGFEELSSLKMIELPDCKLRMKFEKRLKKILRFTIIEDLPEDTPAE